MKDALCRRAFELGFAGCRVALASKAPHSDAFMDWLAQGKFADMNWMQRDPERRTDPGIVLPGARSVIVLSTDYLSRNPGRQKCPGKIARYAWGLDYHDVITPKLRELDRFLQGHGGVQKVYVDTGPVLERDFAAESGIGWFGKSTMILNAHQGTWFFLSTILSTLELEPDPPLPNRCGTCTRCIDACPTGAITAPYQLDARRCISYLTIENKGSIPEEFRRLIGDRIYGCDDCLAVCPWNRFAKASREAAFTLGRFLGMSLREFLALDDDAFRALFRGSPIKRIKRRGFLRNVCVAIGNTGTLEDIPALKAALCDNEPLIAEHARWAIQEIVSRAETPSGSQA